MKQFQVPQFIDVEDRILGPITMRQFFIMLIPFGTGILTYFVLRPFAAIIITIPVLIGAAVFAFYKPYGMSFSRFFSAFLAYQLKPRMYMWRREEAPGAASEDDDARQVVKTQEPQKNAPRGMLRDKKNSIETGSVYKGGE